MEVMNKSYLTMGFRSLWIIVDENGHAFVWKTETFEADKCTVYPSRGKVVMDALKVSFPNKTLSWRKF